MHIPLWRWRFAVMGAAVLAAVTGLSVGFGRGDDPPPPREAEKEKWRYVGARFCKRCHDLERPSKDYNTDYVLLTEYKTWHEEDKHAQAYYVLTQDRSQKMGIILDWNVEEDPRCLNCHAANVPEKSRSNDFAKSDGVSCDVCHGPASQWIVEHADKEWRTKAPAYKQKLGMYDVRDPVKLARLCVSCHVGSVVEGKVVTHEMYAAGHPPLPSIEVGAFCEQMPRHWRDLRQKPEPVQKEIRAAFNIPQEEQERTKRTVVGAVVAFQASMVLLGDWPGGGAKKERIERSPELANYDCYACHHELKSPSWRQKRGYTGRPGRPPMHAWPTVLLEDALRYAEDADLTKQYNEQMQNLRRAFDARPFGDPKEVVECAGQLRDWSERLLQRLQKVRYNSSSARRLVRGLCGAKEAEKYDYDSARQKAWAIDVILKELEPKPTDRVQKSLADLNQQLKLDLRSGTKNTKKQILPELPERLHFLNEYDPEKFKSALEKLGPLLSRE
jgi:hypothetical protein